MNVRLLSILLFSTLLLVGCVNNPPNVPAATASATDAATVNPSTSTAAPVGASADVKTYSNELYQIQYPSDWADQESGQGVVIFQTPASGPQDAIQENVNVVLVPTDSDMEAFVQAALSESVETPGFQLIESSEATLSGKPARRVIYSEQSDDANLQYMQTFTVNAGWAAIVTYTATPETFAQYKTQADAMAASFQFKTDAVASAQASVQAIPAESSMAPEIVRKWRVYSESIFYDAGGSNFLETPATTLLQINADQTWSFGSSTGTWSVQAIADADWQKWGVNSYGPTRKLVLNGWNGETNDGPIEETASRVDFMWVIYRVGPPIVQDPGQIQMKFGWTNQQG